MILDVGPKAVQIAVAVNIPERDVVCAAVAQELRGRRKDRAAQVEPDLVTLNSGSAHKGIRQAVAVQIADGHGSVTARSQALTAVGEDSSAVVQPDLARPALVHHKGVQVAVVVQVSQPHIPPAGRVAEHLTAVAKGPQGAALQPAVVQPDSVPAQTGQEKIEVAIAVQVARSQVCAFRYHLGAGKAGGAVAQPDGALITGFRHHSIQVAVAVQVA